jgi:hypothetical protein
MKMTRKLSLGILAFVLSFILAATHAFATSFASIVIDSSPLGSPDINTVDELLGPPDGQITAFEEVDSFTPGFVTVGFGTEFFNVTGNDILIYLYDWTPSDNEVFEVFASPDGSPGSFISLGSAGTPNGGVGAPVTLGFDLGTAGLASASYLRIVNLRIHPLDGEGPDIDAIEAIAPGNQGSIGTEFTIKGSNFGSRKGNVSIDGMKLKVIDWKSDSILCKLTRPLPPQTYDLMIKPFRKIPILYESAFTVNPPLIYLVDPVEVAESELVTIHGMYFGTKRGKVYLEYDHVGISRKINCKISSWEMECKTGESMISFIIPRGSTAGASLIRIVNSIGEDTVEFTISP